MHTSIAELRHAVWACGALTLLSAGAVAQTPQESEQTPAPPPAVEAPADPATPAAQPVADQKIDQFATAYIAVQEIQAQASQQLAATTDVAKADQVKQSAESNMIKAVERTGLQITEFNQIVQAMATDTTLRARVSDRIGERKRTS